MAREQMILIDTVSGDAVGAVREFDLPEDRSIIDSAAGGQAWVKYVQGAKVSPRKGETAVRHRRSEPMPFDAETTKFIDGWRLEGTYTPPVPTAEQYAERVSAAKQSVVDYAESLTVQLKGVVLTDEQASWPDKKDAAYLYQASVDAGSDHATAYMAAGDTPSGHIGRVVIDNEISLTGEDWPAVAAKIIARAEFFALAIGKVTAVRRNTFAAIDGLGATPTVEQIDGIITAAQTQASTEFAAVLAQLPE